MKIATTSTPQGVTTTIDYETPGPRRCGGCTLCCKLLPNTGLEKPAGVPCVHQRSGKGCRIYARRPMECESWACRWLAAEDETAGMKRPDRAHYVIDALLDTVRLTEDESGKKTELSVLQVWIDPAFPAAAADPQLRAYMLKMAEEHGLATLLRWSLREATAVFPPPLSSDREWHERRSNCSEAVGLYSQLPQSFRPPG